MLFRDWKGHSSAVFGLAFSPDEKTLASTEFRGHVKLWDVATGFNRANFDESGIAVAFAPSGKVLAIADGMGTRLWSLEDGKTLATLEPHESPFTVQGIAFSPDGRRVATVGYDGVLKLSDTQTGKRIASIPAHTKWAKSVSISSDGKLLISAGYDSFAVMRDAETLREIQRLKHTEYLRSAVFSPDAKSVATAGDEVIRIWNSADGIERLSLQGHNGVVYSVAYTPDGKGLVSGSADRSVKVWDLSAVTISQTLGHPDQVFQVAIARSGKFFATGCADGSIRVYAMKHPVK